MKFIDMHCDTLMQLIGYKYEGEKVELYENNLNIDIRRMKESDYKAQVFACFIHKEAEPFGKSHFNDALEMIEILKSELDKNKEIIKLATDFESLKSNEEAGLLSAFISVEEGGVIEEDLERLKLLYDMGVRIITLTWNFENSIGYPNHKWAYQNLGLKPFGREVVEYMDELGVIVDVSHLSDGGFEDIYKYGRKPFLATHSNSRLITNHPRNMSDDMIKKLANKGGLMGLAFAPSFLDGEKSTIDTMIHHTKHILNVGGDEILGLGSDFDGIPQENLELEGCQDMPKLVQAFERGGLTPRQIDGILFENFEKFLDRYENY